MLRTLVFSLLIFAFTKVYSQNVVVIIIDGARYSETFGDPGAEFIPNMAQMAQQGSIITEFYNDSLTYTSRAVPALWTGSRTQVESIFFNGNQTQCTIKPSIFEYFRKQHNIEETKCIHELAYVSSLWLQSFHYNYGQNYWPYTVSQGNSDADVLQNTLADMENFEPQLLWVYLSDVDHAGHSGDWTYYTNAIKTADSVVFEIWNKIQSMPFYQNKTTLLITNDHGRHDDLHGGFQGHGCSCQGCRHIMFLAMGPHVKSNFVSTQYRRIPDVAKTAGALLNTKTEYSTGNIISEIFDYNIDIENIEPNNYQITDKFCSFHLQKSENVDIEIFNSSGVCVEKLSLGILNTGFHTINIDNEHKSGIFIIKLSRGNSSVSEKMFFY